jgi:hypothetical protein
MTDLVISKDRLTYRKILPTRYSNGSLKEQEARRSIQRDAHSSEKYTQRVLISLIATATKTRSGSAP